MTDYRVVDGGMIEIVERAALYADRTAMIAPEGTFAYSDLIDDSARAASAVLHGRPDLGGARVAFPERHLAGPVAPALSTVRLWPGVLNAAFLFLVAGSVRYVCRRNKKTKLFAKARRQCRGDGAVSPLCHAVLIADRAPAMDVH